METFDGHGYLESVTYGGLHDTNLCLFWWEDGDEQVYIFPLLSLFSFTFSCPICYLYTASKYR